MDEGKTNTFLEIICLIEGLYEVTFGILLIKSKFSFNFFKVLN